MPQDLAIDFLTISRYAAPPAPPTVARALSAANLGSADYADTAPPPADAPGGGRERIGTHTVRPSGLPITAKIVVTHHTGGVLAGMGEAAFSALTRGLNPDDQQTLQRGALALELRLKTTDSLALPALDWAMRTLRVLLDLTEGAAIDPAAQRCYGRSSLARFDAKDPMVHVAVHNESWDADSRWIHTHGLQKFGRPELDIVAVPVSLESDGASVLREVAASLARGATLAAGQEIVLEDVGAVVAVGVAPDPDHQAPHGRLHLADLPAPGARQPEGINELLTRVVLAEAARRTAAGDVPGALDNIERALSANPDDCAALVMKARVYLRAGQTMNALELGEFMELRAPANYRGPLTVGMALAAMGRYREALVALDRAVQREPEASEAYLARAAVHAGMGHDQLATVDRARAAYLA